MRALLPFGRSFDKRRRWATNCIFANTMWQHPGTPFRVLSKYSTVRPLGVITSCWQAHMMKWNIWEAKSLHVLPP